MTKKIDATKFVEQMQDACEGFIEKNGKTILGHLKTDRIRLDVKKLPGTEVKKVGDKDWGVYAFFVIPKTPITGFDDFEKLWKNDSNGKKIEYSPAAIKARFSQPVIKTEPPRCLYVGKSEELAKRIKQHIHQETNQSTYGLKLSKHDQMLSCCDFEYSFYPIATNPTESLDGWKCLLVTLEKYLREKFTPLVGKQ